MKRDDTGVILDGPKLGPRSGGLAEQLIIILHGYGADGDDVIGLGHAFCQALPNAAIIAPNAPEYLPYEALGGRQWFALNERTPDEYRIGAEASQPVLDRFIDQQLGFYNLTEQSLALVGFSQGAMMAFQSGLRRKSPPAALVAFSGLLPGIDRLKEINTETPVLIVHGQDDVVVPPYHLEGAETALSRAGVSVNRP